MVTGSGTQADPFMLYNLNDLVLVGSGGSYTLSAYYKLANDIDASASSSLNGGVGWAPINWFTGNFNGNGKTISGLFFNRPGVAKVGFFGSLQGTVTQLTLANCNITGGEQTGGIAGDIPSAGGNITYCSVSGSVSGSNYVGMIAGSLTSTGVVSHNTVSSGTITASGNSVGGIIGFLTNSGFCDYNSVSGLTFSNLSSVDQVGGIIGLCSAVNSVSYNSVNVNITARDYVGGLLGYHYSGGTFVHNSIQGAISGRGYVGGFVGAGGTSGAGTFDGTTNTFNITVTGSGSRVGGLFGACTNNMVITNFNIDQVTNIITVIASASVSDYVGGIAGEGNTTISYCTFYGDISGHDYVGGIDGKRANNYTVSFCKYSGKVTGRKQVGGLIGDAGTNAKGTITKCFSSGNVSGTSQVGGLVGVTNDNIDNCYSASDVSGTDYIGGLIGYNQTGEIKRCYSAGKVTGSTDKGGLVGVNSTGTNSDSFWDTEKSTQATSGLGTGKTTAQMKTQDTYTNWDFNTPVWDMDTDSRNNGYPYLDALKPDLPKQSGSEVWFKLRNRFLKID